MQKQLYTQTTVHTNKYHHCTTVTGEGDHHLAATAAGGTKRHRRMPAPLLAVMALASLGGIYCHLRQSLPGGGHRQSRSVPRTGTQNGNNGRQAATNACGGAATAGRHRTAVAAHKQLYTQSTIDTYIHSRATDRKKNSYNYAYI